MPCDENVPDAAAATRRDAEKSVPAWQNILTQYKSRATKCRHVLLYLQSFQAQDTSALFNIMYGRHIQQIGINRDICKSCSWSAEQGQTFFSLSTFATESLVSGPLRDTRHNLWTNYQLSLPLSVLRKKSSRFQSHLIRHLLSRASTDFTLAVEILALINIRGRRGWQGRLNRRWRRQRRTCSTSRDNYDQKQEGGMKYD